MKKIFALVISSLALVSCEKVIDIDLNESDPKYVIEGVLELGNLEFQVNVSQTSSYFEADTVIGIEGATVTISDNFGNQDVLFDQGSGSYAIPLLLTGSNIEYTLSVNIGGEVFEAKALMPNLVEADTAFIGEENRPEITFTDPVEDENNYRIQLFKNGEQIDASRRSWEILVDDVLTNGNTTNQRLGSGGGFGDDDDPIISGDEIIVKLQSMDARGFRFFRTLEDVSGGNGPGATAPGNPVNNWSNGALGYFAAVAIDTHTLIVP